MSKRLLIFCTTGLGNFVNLTPTIEILCKYYILDIILDKRRGFFEHVLRWSYFNNVYELMDCHKIDYNSYTAICFSLFSEFNTPKLIMNYIPKEKIISIDSNRKKKDHEVFLNLELLKELKIEFKTRCVTFFNYSDFALDEIRRSISEKPHILLSPGCNNTKRWIKKRWNSSNWLRLYSMLISDNFDVRFIGIKDDYDDLLWRSISKQYIDIGLDKTCALIELCAYIIGIDNGLMHVAGALGKSGMALFGPADPMKDKPLCDSIYAYSSDNICSFSPCLSYLNGLNLLDECKFQFCMNSIKPEYVYKYFCEKLKVNSFE